MIFQYMKTYLGLIQMNGFTAASKHLGMTQPGVSQHIKALEEHFKIQLIIREKKKVVLTEAGKRLHKYIEKLFSDMEDLRQSLGEDDPHSGICRLASPGSFGIKMYTFLLKLQSQYPKLIIHYEYAPNNMIIKNLLEDKIDLAFVTKQPQEADLDWEKMDEERLCLVLPSKHKDMSFKGLQRLGFINHPDGHHHASRLFQLNYPHEFQSMNQIPNRGFINQISRIPEPVAMNLGFTALPEYSASVFQDQKKIQIWTMKYKVIDPIYRVFRRGQKLPCRFDFLKKEFVKFQKITNQ